MPKLYLGLTDVNYQANPDILQNHYSSNQHQEAFQQQYLGGVLISVFPFNTLVQISQFN